MTPKWPLLLALVAPIPARGAERSAITVRADPPRLSWSAFRHVDSIPGSSEDARIAAEMSFPRSLRIEQSDGSYRMPPFTITVTTEPTRTMVRRSAGASSLLLRHEQGHFDIVVLAARALAREIESTTSGSAAELSRRVKALVDEHTARAERLSEAYDRDTAGSRNATAQARWSEMIAAAMRHPAPSRLAELPL